MLSEELKTAIGLAAGIEKFEIGPNYEVDTEGHRKEQIWIRSIWVIEFSKHYKVAVLAGMLISGSESPVIRCVLLLPRARGYGDPNPISFIGRAPFRAFDLDYPDAISMALQSVNLLPVGFSLTAYPFKFAIYTHSLSGFSYQEHQGDLEGQNMETLWDAILDTLEHMVRLYDDPEISHLFDTKQIP
jgi:hypothetical protein